MGFHSFSHGEASTRQVTVFKEGVNPANLRGFTPGQTFGQEAPTDTKVYEDIRHRLKKQNELLEHEFQNQVLKKIQFTLIQFIIYLFIN